MRRRRRRRLLPLAALIAIVAFVVLVLGRSGSGGGGASTAAGPTVRTTMVARLAKPLPAPISAESVVGLPGGPLILGGLDSSEASASGVFQLDRSAATCARPGR